MNLDWHSKYRFSIIVQIGDKTGALRSLNWATELGEDMVSLGINEIALGEINGESAFRDEKEFLRWVRESEPTTTGQCHEFFILKPSDVDFDVQFFPSLLEALDGGSSGLTDIVVIDSASRCPSSGVVHSPIHLPGWDPDFALVHDYLASVFVVSREYLARFLRSDRSISSLRDWLHLVALASRQPRVLHLDSILVYRQELFSEKFEPHHASPEVLPIDDSRISVSLVIPNRESLPMLRKALAFVDYLQGVDLELVIVDHQSRDPELFTFYRELEKRFPFKLVHYERGFNYSVMINAGIEASSCPVVVMMNNDVEITYPEAFRQMVAHAMRPEVGVVGSKLLYPDGRVQHAGVHLVERGHADHIMRFVPGDDARDLGILSTIRNYQAVTGALMASRREIFDEMEGFNEVYLPIEYNDVDYCLKVREKGYRVICLPLKGIYHHESASRGKELDAMGRMIRSEASRYMALRWRAEFQKDPFLNKNIDYAPAKSC